MSVKVRGVAASEGHMRRVASYKLKETCSLLGLNRGSKKHVTHPKTGNNGRAFDKLGCLLGPIRRL